jgi:exopolyphosphatase / guanosine-5'-triphosphate,3'-diphosphate pyrophosphatase
LLPELTPAPTGAGGTLSGMRIAIIDVGSNTIRLLIAHRRDSGEVEPVREERTVVGLGAEIERLGRISDAKLDEAAESTREFARLARLAGCDAIDVVITAPGRQSGNAERLVSVLEHAADAPVRVLSAREEGALAYLGAVRRAADVIGPVAVCDIGGGSTELAVGLADGSPDWLRSFETGSLRLTRRYLHDGRPSRKALRAARGHVREHLVGTRPPWAGTALATGGAARALRKLSGRSLGAEELAGAVDTCTRLGPGGLARRYDIDPARAATLLAGAIILSELQELVGVPFLVARGGLREGLAHSLLVDQVAA